MSEIEGNIEGDTDDTDERIPVEFSTQTKRLVCIEYPGHVKSVSKVIQTLGGEKEVNTILQDPLRRVGLRMRPKDPYSRQAFADRFPVSDVLMKVKRRKKKGKEEYQYQCEILGVIDTVVKFKGLFDFQYLAPDVPDLLHELHGSEILEIKTPLHLPPPIFARVDHPFDYQYRPEPKSRSGDQVEDNERASGTIRRKPRPNYVFSCGFSTPTIPETAQEEAVNELKRYHNDGLDIVQHLFNVRPVWSRRALIYHLGPKAIRLRHILPCVAYYWTGGPWRTLWTKLGYDPRTTPAAKIYQKLDFRLRAKKALRGMKLPPTIRSIYDFSLHTGVQKRHQKIAVVPTGIDTTTQDCNQPSTSKEGTEEEQVEQHGKTNIENPEILPYVFRADRPPPTRNYIYQLCDIHCAEAQKLISANDGKETSCNNIDGWLLPGTNEKIRQVLTESLIKGMHDKDTAPGGTTSNLVEDDLLQLPGDIEEEEASFLDTLMDDDDVEAYDILDDC